MLEQTNHPIRFRAFYTLGGASKVGLAITAKVIAPNGASSTIAVAELGDGLYQTASITPSQTGEYTCIFQAPVGATDVRHVAASFTIGRGGVDLLVPAASPNGFGVGLAVQVTSFQIDGDDMPVPQAISGSVWDASAETYDGQPDTLGGYVFGTQAVLGGINREIVGTLVAVGNSTTCTATTITLVAGASAVSGHYVGCEVWLSNSIPNAASYQARTIVAYDGTTRVATIDRPWATTPTSLAAYTIRLKNQVALDSQLRVATSSTDAATIAAIDARIPADNLTKMARLDVPVSSVGGGGSADLTPILAAIDELAIDVDGIEFDPEAIWSHPSRSITGLTGAAIGQVQSAVATAVSGAPITVVSPMASSGEAHVDANWDYVASNGLPLVLRGEGALVGETYGLWRDGTIVLAGTYSADSDGWVITVPISRAQAGDLGRGDHDLELGYQSGDVRTPLGRVTVSIG